jgi:hypothetical protein
MFWQGGVTVLLYLAVLVLFAVAGQWHAARHRRREYQARREGRAETLRWKAEAKEEEWKEWN